MAEEKECSLVVLDHYISVSLLRDMYFDLTLNRDKNVADNFVEAERIIKNRQENKNAI